MDAYSYNTLSHYQDRCGAQIWLFCSEFESMFGRKDAVLTIKGSDMLWKTHNFVLLCIQWRIWNTQSALDACNYKAVLHFFGWLSAKTLVILLEIWGSVGKKRHCVDHEGIIYAVRGISNHSHTFKECWETLKQQWISVLMTQHYSSWLIWRSKLVILIKIWE